MDGRASVDDGKFHMADASRKTGTAPAALLQTHPAVAQALVVDGFPGGGPAVWIVPDQHAAPMLHRSVLIEQSGRLDTLEWHEPAEGVPGRQAQSRGDGFPLPRDFYRQFLSA